MGTVKYTGPVASFHCPTEATIRSLKVHFSPKQLGEGTPSPENVRPIEGWTGLNVYQSGINLFNPNVDTTEQPSDKIVAPFKYVLGAWFRGGWSYYSTSLITSFSVKKNGISFVCDDARYCIAYLLPIKGGVNIRCTYRCFENNVEIAGRGILFAYLDEKQQYITLSDVSSGSVVSVPETAHYIKVSFNATNNVEREFSDISILLPNDITSTTYEPYYGETVNYEFGVLGKNKFDYTNADIVNRKRLDDNGNEVSDATGSYCKLKIPVIPNKEYTLSGYTASSSKRIYYYNIDGDFISRSGTYSGSSFTFTTLSDCYYIQIQLNEESTSGWDTTQLELGSTATAYEPYDPNKTVYGGWVDLISGEVQQEYDKIILDGSFNPGIFPWAADVEDENGTIITHALYFKRDTYDNKHKRDAGAYCDQLQWYNINNVRDKIGFGMYDGSSYSACLMLPKEWIGDTNETLNSYLSANPITIVSELATPITYNLPPHSAALQTFLSTNNIWSNADYVEVEYDLHETQTILARKQFIMASQPHIETASGSIASFETDMVAPLKECKVGFKPAQDLHGYSKPWVGGSGKNLFNINAIEQNPSDTTAANTTQRIFTPGTYAVGASYSNYWHDTNVTSYTINDDIITITSFSGYGIGFTFSATPGTSYVASATITTLTAGTTASGNINIAYYDAEGNFINMGYNGSNLNGIASVAPEDAAVLVVIFRGPNKDTTVAFSNIQVEEGSTATTYEPYENICPISGWNNINIHRTGKNLIDENYLIDANNYPNAGNYGYYYTDDIQLIPNTRYRFVWYNYDNTALSEFGVTSINLYVQGASEYIVNNANYRQYSSGFLTPSTGIIRFGIYHPSSLQRQDVLNAIFNNGKLLLQIGTNDENYEPYTGTTLPIDWSSAGTVYGGYVDLVNGEVWETERLFDCADYLLNYSDIEMVNGNLCRIRSIKFIPVGDNLLTNGMAEIFTPFSGSWGQMTTLNDEHIMAGYNYVGFSSSNFGFTTKEEWFNYLTQNHIKFCASLATPTLITTLDLITLKSLRGVNNIWSNANGDIEVKFWKH